MNTLELLIKNFSRLPGLGRKSASRIAYFLLKKDRAFLENLGNQIMTLKDKIKTCSVCGNYTETDPCPICSDPGRDGSTICVVEQAQDVYTIESTREYNGMYHVLGGVISPIDGIGPRDINLASLVRRAASGTVGEVIFALNPNVEGDTTTLYLVRELQSAGVKLTRLASGLPVGGDLEYAGTLTLSRSLKGRIPVKGEE